MAFLVSNCLRSTSHFGYLQTNIRALSSRSCPTHDKLNKLRSVIQEGEERRVEYLQIGKIGEAVQEGKRRCIKFDGIKYVGYATRNGMVFQTLRDWNQCQHTGIYFPNDPKEPILFNGQPVNPLPVEFIGAINAFLTRNKS